MTGVGSAPPFFVLYYLAARDKRVTPMVSPLVQFVRSCFLFVYTFEHFHVSSYLLDFFLAGLV